MSILLGSISPDAQRAKNISETANGLAQEALKKVNEIDEKLPEYIKKSDQIPRDINEANIAIKRAEGQGET